MARPTVADARAEEDPRRNRICGRLADFEFARYIIADLATRARCARIGRYIHTDNPISTQDIRLRNRFRFSKTAHNKTKTQGSPNSLTNKRRSMYDERMHRSLGGLALGGPSAEILCQFIIICAPVRFQPNP